SASISAVAAPMPEDAPVTRAVWPVRSSWGFIVGFQSIASGAEGTGGAEGYHRSLRLLRWLIHAHTRGAMPSITRRMFLGGLGAAALGAGCRSRAEHGPIVLRLSHSMTAGPTALHVFGDRFRELAEAATGGAVKIRVFPSGTLGQEREVVQQLQEGLVDFMVSGTAIW